MNYEEYTVKVFENGTICWLKDGKSHRLDGPAVEYSNGYKIWYKNGKLHRINGPAVEHTNGDKFWYKNDKLHRIDGPAFEGHNRYKEYYIEGKRLTEEQFLEKTKSCEGKVVEIDGKKYKLIEL